MINSNNDTTHLVGTHKQHLPYKIEKNMGDGDVNDIGVKNISTSKEYIKGILNEECFKDGRKNSFLYNFQSFLTENFKMPGSSKEFICGWGAALVNIGITFPINKIIFRQVSKMYI